MQRTDYSNGNIKERFENSIEKDPETGCWLWMKSRRKGGYGRMKINGKDEVASRVAWILFIGPIPEEIEILHRCDNPPCANPSHLFLGTEKDNKQDSVNKGRHAYGERNGGGGKLTGEDVKTIKEDHRPYKEISMHFGVSLCMIQGIKSGRLWKNVTGPIIKGMNHIKGSRHHESKLTEEIVSDIKQDIRSNKEISRNYSVAISTVACIKAGTTWKHVLTPVHKNKVGRPSATN